MPHECAASLDNVRVVLKAYLTARICSLGPVPLAASCAALRAAVDS